MSILERSKQVKVQQISLKERLERLSKGYPSDPAFVISAIRSLADIPIERIPLQKRLQKAT